MTTFLIGLVFVVVLTGAYVVLRNAQDFSDANQVIPGVPTTAPKEWAGAHTPEARLHRRLRDAVEPLRATSALDREGLEDIREQLEEHALRIDEHLVTVASLPKARREQPLGEVEAAVEAIEEAVAEIVTLHGPGAPDLEAGLEAVRTRLRLVNEARAELEGLGRPATDLTGLQEAIEADRDRSRATADDPPDDTASPA